MAGPEDQGFAAIQENSRMTTRANISVLEHEALVEALSRLENELFKERQSNAMLSMRSEARGLTVDTLKSELALERMFSARMNAAIRQSQQALQACLATRPPVLNTAPDNESDPNDKYTLCECVHIKMFHAEDGGPCGVLDGHGDPKCDCTKFHAHVTIPEERS